MSKPTKSIGRNILNFYYKEVFDELEKTLGETFTNLPQYMVHIEYNNYI